MIVRGSALRTKARLPRSIGWTTNAQTSQHTGGPAPLRQLRLTWLQAFCHGLCAAFHSTFATMGFQH